MGPRRWAWSSRSCCCACGARGRWPASNRRKTLKPRTRRALWILAGVAGLGIATALVLNAFNENLVFFYTPTQVADHAVPRDRPFRIDGRGEPGRRGRHQDAL